MQNNYPLDGGQPKKGDQTPLPPHPLFFQIGLVLTRTESTIEPKEVENSDKRGRRTGTISLSYFYPTLNRV